MTLKERFWSWLAWRLPRRLVYWSAVRLFSRATVKEYSETEPGKLLVVKALQRWS
jgi:hypothetical protein